MPQSLRARATPLEPQANRRRLDRSSPDRRRRIDLVQIVVGDWSSPDHRRCRSSLALIGDRLSRRRLVLASAALAFRPPYSVAPVLPPSRYFVFLFY